MKFTQIIPVLGLGIACWALPSTALACHEVTLCVEFTVAGDDVAIGDLPEQTAGEVTIPARGVRVWVIPPVPEPPFEKIIESVNGCFTYNTQFASGHKVIVHPEAFLGDIDEDGEDVDPNIRIAAFDSCTQVTNEIDGIGGTMIAPMLVHAHNLVVNAVGRPPIEADTPSKKVFAWAIWIVARFNDALAPGLQNEELLAVWSQERGEVEVDGALGEGCLSAQYGAYATDKDFYVHPAGAGKKFLIGHEIGHWLQFNWTELDVNGEYAYAAQDDDCKFAVDENEAGSDLHGIRSAEPAGGALVEGWGHFLSTWAFDDGGESDAQFRYYKVIESINGNYDDFIDPDLDDYRVSMLGEEICDNAQPPNCHPLGGELAWVETQCSADWGQSFEVSSEIDWMRFFFQMTSSLADTNDEDLASLKDLLEILTATGDGNPNGEQFLAETPMELQDRAADLDLVNGIYNGD